MTPFIFIEKLYKANFGETEEMRIKILLRRSKFESSFEPHSDRVSLFPQQFLNVLTTDKYMREHLC